MTDTPGGDLEVQDEILQVMYWLRGEKLADDVSARDLERFVGASELQLDGALERLALLGLVRRHPRRRDTAVRADRRRRARRWTPLCG